MRKLYVAAITIAMVVALFPLTAQAARVDAAGFAADCNDDGVVNVADNLRVLGGSGHVTVPLCTVFLADDAKLVFRDATIVADGDLVTFGGLDTILRVVGSTLTADGILELKTSCCIDEPGVPVNGLTRIVDSTLSGGLVYLSSAVSETGGRLVARRNVITSASTLVVPVGGEIRFTNNTVTTGSDTEIAGHDVRVRNNDFNGVGGVVTVTGTVACVTSGNTPAVGCS